MNTIKKNVLRRIKIVFAIRKAFQPLFVEIYVMVLALSGIFFTSSIFNVFENLSASSGGVGDVLAFSYRAFLNTELIVQSLFVIILLVAGFLIRDLSSRLIYNTFSEGYNRPR